MVSNHAPVTLSPEQLNDTDERILDVLRDGRVTPRYAADRMGVSRPYASERLKRLVEHDHVEKLASGLYELVDDPRGGVDDDADIDAARKAFADLLDARERVDQEAIDAALEELGEALGVEDV